MSIPIITRTNTIDEWRIQTNQEATALNNLEAGDYTKSNGILTVSGNSQVIITANGTSLQVSNSALFQSNVTIGGDVGIGVQETATGNTTIGGVLTVRGPGTALQVSNNALGVLFVNNNNGWFVYVPMRPCDDVVLNCIYIEFVVNELSNKSILCI